VAKPARSLKFEEALTRLDEIVEAMESGEIGLEESITRYEEAMELAARCRKTLEDAELRLRKIQQRTDGSLAVSESAPVDDSAAAADDGEQGAEDESRTDA
jgi:exodeoxyribonuclease VII small subunit